MDKKFIRCQENTDAALFIRKNFSVSNRPKRATIRMSALGCYQAYLNEERVDSQIFLPGRTSYSNRVQYQEYDITDNIVVGNNCVAAFLTKGWYNKQPEFYCQVETSYEKSSTK